jgi:hypothetical protein
MKAAALPSPILSTLSVKTGKAQNEQMLSGLPPKADLGICGFILSQHQPRLHEQRERDLLGRGVDIAAMLGGIDQQCGGPLPRRAILIAGRQCQDESARVGERFEHLAVA